MTMVASGPIDLGGTATSGGLSRSINLEFGYGANLNAYRGLLYTNASGSVISQFPNTSNSIGMSQFYSTRKIPAGSVTYTSSSTFSVPAYNTLQVIIRAAGGQGGGDRGINACASPSIATAGGTGSTGGTSQFGVSPAAVFGTAPGGTGGGDGGSTGTTQSGYGFGGNTSNAGGNGAGSGGAGGGGGVTVLSLANPITGGPGPSSGSSVSVLVGQSSPVTNGGPNSSIIAPFGCLIIGNAGSGSAGGAGSVSISWS